MQVGKHRPNALLVCSSLSFSPSPHPRSSAGAAQCQLTTYVNWLWPLDFRSWSLGKMRKLPLLDNKLQKACIGGVTLSGRLCLTPLSFPGAGGRNRGLSCGLTSGQRWMRLSRGGQLLLTLPDPCVKFSRSNCLLWLGHITIHHAQNSDPQQITGGFSPSTQFTFMMGKSKGK